MKSKQALGQAIKQAIEKKIQKGEIRFKSEIARDFGVSPSSLTDWERKGSISKDKLFKLFEYFRDVVPLEHWFEEWEVKDPSYARALIASKMIHKEKSLKTTDNLGIQSQDEIFLNLQSKLLAASNGKKQLITGEFHLTEPDSETSQSFEIPYLEARGSCGGGSLSNSNEIAGKLVKEKTWFLKYNIKPSDALVVFADGESMADFIVDGDIVIFNKSKTEPKSGRIYLINHPDGLKIKQLRREIDGTWVLESRNPDKRRYPDERIPSSMSNLLEILGEFIYRQGG